MVIEKANEPIEKSTPISWHRSWKPIIWAATSPLSERVLVACCVCLLAAFVAFGFLLDTVPFVSTDEPWIVSRAEHLMTRGYLADPILPESVSPLFARLFDAGPLNQVGCIVYYATLGIGAKLGGEHVMRGFRLAMFGWSLLACALTWTLARRLGLSAAEALIAVAWMVVVPEFLMQVHIERAEIPLTACVVGALLLAVRAFPADGESPATGWLAAAGLYAWLPAILVHPSGICIPPMFAVLYFMNARSRWLSWRLAMLFVLMAPGAWILAEIVLAPARVAGGSFGLESFGPPIMSRGLWYFAKTPLHFVQRLVESGPLTQALSCTWFLLAMVAGAWLWRSNKGRTVRFLVVAAAAVFLSLTMLSGSTGAYNVLLVPMAAIVLALGSVRIAREGAIPGGLRWSPVVLLIALALALIPSLRFNLGQYRTYEELSAKISRSVPLGHSVLAPALYYYALPRRPFTASYWFSPIMGRDGQSFSAGLRSVGAEFVVLDDQAISAAVKRRTKSWIDEMFDYLTANATVVSDIRTDYYIRPNLVLPGLEYPARWGSARPGFISRVVIFRVHAEANRAFDTASDGAELQRTPRARRMP
jgi:4-amino-4-deoxy-L-arabinose transferase-like glycosyltransferase